MIWIASGNLFRYFAETMPGLARRSALLTILVGENAEHFLLIVAISIKKLI